MTKTSIIKLVSEPTKWVNFPVIIEKPNDLQQICLDPRDLKEVKKREYFQLSTTEKIFADMHGIKCFSKIDVRFLLIRIVQNYSRWIFPSLVINLLTSHSLYIVKARYFQIEIGYIIEGIILPTTIYNKLYWRRKLKSTFVTLNTYNSICIDVLEQYIALITCKKGIYLIMFIIANAARNVQDDINYIRRTQTWFFQDRSNCKNSQP